MSINGIEAVGFTPFTPPTVSAPGAAAKAAAGAAEAAGGVDFSSMVSQSLTRLEGLHDQSSSLAVQAATGDLSNIHDYTIAATEASTMTQLTAAVRNKALESFQEIMRISI
jgi:flagellar hook-basal body complex protein FliE